MKNDRLFCEENDPSPFSFAPKPRTRTRAKQSKYLRNFLRKSSENVGRSFADAQKNSNTPPRPATLPPGRSDPPPLTNDPPRPGRAQPTLNARFWPDPQKGVEMGVEGTTASKLVSCPWLFSPRP